MKGDRYLWGCWKFNLKGGCYEFRPVSEADDNCDEGIVLAVCEYGHRIAIQELLNCPSGEFNGLTVLRSDSTGQGGQTTIWAAEGVMDLIKNLLNDYAGGRARESCPS